MKAAFLKRKFIFCVMGPAYYSSSVDSYLAGPSELFGQVILLAGYFPCRLGGVWGWLPGCGSGRCLSWCAVDPPRLLAPGVEHSGSWGPSGQKARSGAGDVAPVGVAWGRPGGARLVGCFGWCGKGEGWAFHWFGE